MRRRDLIATLAARLDGLHGSLVDQLAADIAAMDTERRPLPLRRVRYVALAVRP